jgi:hypothetical protein
MPTCVELVRNGMPRDRFHSGRYEVLHPDARRLIGHWFRRAHEQRDCDPADSFEPFIFAWIALNGWASCCTDLDQDRQIIEALSASASLEQRFSDSLDQSEPFRNVSGRFRDLWPVFKVQDLRRRRIPMHRGLERREMVADYFVRGAEKFAPSCFRRHVENGEEVPLDWPHVLAAIYQVRCNLFHGDKAPHSEIDRALVHSAFQILVRFLADCGYMP